MSPSHFSAADDDDDADEEEDDSAAATDFLKSSITGRHAINEP